MNKSSLTSSPVSRGRGTVGAELGVELRQQREALQQFGKRTHTTRHTHMLYTTVSLLLTVQHFSYNSSAISLPLFVTPFLP